MVVYLDVLFAVNALMDGATLLAAARLGGVQVRKMRLIFQQHSRRRLCRAGAVWLVLTPCTAVPSAGLGLCMIAFGRERHLCAAVCTVMGGRGLVRRTGGGAECRKRQEGCLVRVPLCGADTGACAGGSCRLRGKRDTPVRRCEARRAAPRNRNADHPVRHSADRRARAARHRQRPDRTGFRKAGRGARAQGRRSACWTRNCRSAVRPRS